ncbi:MAG: universal stress protein [Actinomycetota bacterium]|nr:universal stress protein [Actinomycetota bacterium]
MTHPEDVDVPAATIADLGGAVIVGDDGSEAAANALLWAAEAAVQRQRALHVVRAWTMRTAVRPKDWTPGYVPSLEEFARACKETAQRDVTATLEGSPGPAVQVHALHGEPAKVLLAASQEADLLVVGWRGRGLRERLLGSVAETVTREAACTVVVVRPFRP